MEINQGCRKKRRGAVIFDGVLICIKIGSLTQLDCIGQFEHLFSTVVLF